MNSESNLVGLVGLKGSGKSEAARALSEHRTLSLADPLKQAAGYLFNLSHAQCYTQEGKKEVVEIPLEYGLTSLQLAVTIILKTSPEVVRQNLPINTRKFSDLIHSLNDKLLEVFSVEKLTVREILQQLGTEVCRDIFGPDVWLDNLSRRAASYGKVVVDDVRFPNEADHIRSLGGILIGIQRDGISADSHPSEQTMVEQWNSMVDITIQNNDTIQTLHQRVRDAIT